MEEGVTVVLDSYGDNVCNLQGIMKMPFRVVKISEHMVERYCQGESDVLEYQIQMLRDNGWEICLEGIEDRQHYEKVKKLGEISYLQGKYYGGAIGNQNADFGHNKEGNISFGKLPNRFDS